MSSLCTIQHSPSAWAGFAPKLTETFTVAVTKSCFHMERVRVIGRHETVVQILVDVIVALHDAL